MRLSLYQRLTLALVGLFIVIACTLSWWSTKLEISSRHEAEQRLHLSLADHLGHDNPLLKEGVYDQNALKNLFHSLMILGPSFEFYFIALSGNIVSYSADADKIKRQHINIAPLVTLLIKKKHCLFMVMILVTFISKKYSQLHQFITVKTFRVIYILLLVGKRTTLYLTLYNLINTFHNL